MGCAKIVRNPTKLEGCQYRSKTTRRGVLREGTGGFGLGSGLGGKGDGFDGYIGELRARGGGVLKEGIRGLGFGGELGWGRGVHRGGNRWVGVGVGG